MAVLVFRLTNACNRVLKAQKTRAIKIGWKVVRHIFDFVHRPSLASFLFVAINLMAKKTNTNYHAIHENGKKICDITIP